MSRIIVLDASAALEAVLAQDHSEPILDLLEEADSVVVPDLYFAEVANALWKYVKSEEINQDSAQERLDLASSLADIVLPATDLASEALAIATAFAHPVYDALYAVSARRKGATVCTLDRRLAKLLEEMRIPVWQPT